MKILEEFFQTLLPKAVSLTGCQHAAKDILQDVAIKIWQHKDQIEAMPYDEQKAYCTTMVMNRFFDCSRKVVRLRAKAAKYWRKHEEQAPPEIEARIELKEAMEHINKINPFHAKAMLASAYGYSTKEIGEALNCPKINSTLGAVRYGRLALQKLTA